jgi:hypothetical protein
VGDGVGCLIFLSSVLLLKRLRVYICDIEIGGWLLFRMPVDHSPTPQLANSSTPQLTNLSAPATDVMMQMGPLPFVPHSIVLGALDSLSLMS